MSHNNPTAPSLVSLYISPDGDDNNPGTMDKPKRTIAAAMETTAPSPESSQSVACKLAWLAGCEGPFDVDKAAALVEAYATTREQRARGEVFVKLEPVVDGLAKAGMALIDQAKAFNSADTKETARLGNLATDGVKQAIDGLRALKQTN